MINPSSRRLTPKCRGSGKHSNIEGGTCPRKNRAMGSKTLLLACMACIGTMGIIPATTTATKVSAFQSFQSASFVNRCTKQAHSGFLGRRTTYVTPTTAAGGRSGRSGQRVGRSTAKSSLNMLLGNDGGILGVGAPEVAVTLLVGYFVLGPSELYKLVKEIGKFIQNFRTLGAEATKSLESTMENQLELTELRKAQRELNEAFSFRRSINTDEMAEAFAEGNVAAATAVAGAGAAGATAAGGVAPSGEVATTEEEGTKKKKRRLVRRKKKKVEEELPEITPNLATEYPDLDMLDVPTDATTPTLSEEERLRAERLERLSPTKDDTDWFNASEEDIASQVLNSQPNTPNPAMESYESQRFNAQLSAEDWNAQIMANEDKLSPLSMVMQRLAILEEEKRAADQRLEEEYQRRMENEDKYYLEKRRVLEEAAGSIQDEVMSKMASTPNGEDGEKTEGGVKGGVANMNETKFT